MKAQRWLSQLEARRRAIFPPVSHKTPPGPPVVLGSALAIWLFARSNITELMLALLVACVVSMVLTRARRDADAAMQEAALLRGQLADAAFGMRMANRYTWTIDFEQRCVRLGEGSEAFLGVRLTFEDAANAAPSFVHPEDRATVTRMHADALEHGEAEPAHVRLLRADGGLRWVRYGLQVRRSGARIEAISVVADDITQYQQRGQVVMEHIAQAERQLAASRPELERLLADIGVDIPRSGLAPDAVLPPPGGGRQIEDAAQRFGRILQEFAARRIAFHQAVTALKTARGTSDLFAQMADRSRDAMMIFGPDGMVEWVNPAFETMTGWSFADVRGKDVRKMLLGPETNLDVLQDLSAQMHARGEGGCEILLYRRDGEPYWADVRGGRMRSDDGGMSRTFLIKRDLTARKTIEAELESALVEARAGNAAKSEFLANMSHELRTPLNAVIGYSEMLEEELGATEAGRDAARIRDAGKHLLSVINGIIELARAEAQQVDVLAIDPDRRQRDACLRTLTRLGFACAGVDNADEALAHIEQKPALVLINCAAPEGWDALQTAVSAFAGAPILALTSPGDGPEAAAAGAAAFLDAPANATALAAAVVRYARRRDEEEADAAPLRAPAEREAG